MEIFLIAGINSIPADVRKIADLAKEIGPDRIQLNTAIRPPAEDYATALSEKRMESLTDLCYSGGRVPRIKLQMSSICISMRYPNISEN